MPVEAALGVWFDLNFGLRVQLPPYDGPTVRKIKIYADDQEPYETTFVKEGFYINDYRCYYIKYRIELFEDEQLVYQYELDLKDQPVLIQLEGALGDTIAWMPYIERFVEKHGCNLVALGMRKDIIPLFRSTYPNINIVDLSVPTERWVKTKKLFAVYVIAYQSDDGGKHIYLPAERKHIPLTHVPQYILGLKTDEELKPRINIMSPNGRPIKEKYVVIGAEATTGAKMWNNPGGWSTIVDYLRLVKGYRVVCIDKDWVFGRADLPGLITHMKVPDGLEDQTGARPLPERARWLAHADLYIGLGSGMSWLAWAVNTPVVLISGFSEPYTEFSTPYRVINRDVCHGCWNDTSVFYDRADWWWCPRHTQTERMFECSVKITADQVYLAVEQALTDNGH